MKLSMIVPAWIGVLAVSFALAGCKSSSSTGTGDTLAKVKASGVLRWGADDSGGGPHVFKDPENPARSIGFEVDIMNCVAHHMGVRQEMVVSQWDALIENLKANRTDMVMNGIEINPEREKQVLFSIPYYLYEQQLAVRAEDKDKYKTLADLKGHKVATLSGAQANNVLKEAGWTDDRIQPMPDSQTPYEELVSKRVDAVVQEDLITAFYASPAKNPKVFMIPATFSPGKYAVAVRPGDQSLVNEINRVLELMMDNGELAEIYQRWNIMNDRQTTLGVKTKAAATAPAATLPAK